jgi:transcriptional regulator with XRE-family HTH domain
MTRLPAESATLASNVRILRQQRGWSQAELARRVTDAGAPMKANRVATIEAPGPDARTVSIDQAAAFAEALGVKLEALLKFEQSACLALAWSRFRQAKDTLDRVQAEYDEAQRALAEVCGRDPR